MTNLAHNNGGQVGAMTVATFDGLVFIPNESLGRAASITPTREGLAAVERANGQQHTLPYAGIRFDIGGESGHVVFCRPPIGASGVTMTCEHPGFIEAVRTQSGGHLDATLHALATHGAKKRRLGRVFAIVGVAIVALLFVGLWWVPTRGLPAAAEQLPISVDRRIGDSAIESMNDELGPQIHTPATDAALREIVGRLAPQARTPGFDYRFRVVRRRELNAFALPGGQIVVFEGLLRRAARPDQVAGVLGHEIAHVTFRHGIRAVARSAGVSIAVRVLLGDASALGDVMRSAGASAILNSYSRDQESDADAEGARMVAAAGLDPRGLEEFFALMRNEPHTEMPGMLAWMSTHPGHDDRIGALERLIPTLPRGPAVPISVPWSQVQAELNALGPIPAHE